MGVEFTEQTVTFLMAVFIGLCLCLVYDVFRILRLIFRPKPFPVFVQDVLYAFLAGVVTFLLLLLRVRGEVRMFVLAGELTGFLICRFTVSAVIYASAYKVVSALRKFKRWVKRRIIRPVLRLFRRFFGFLGKCLTKVWTKIKKIIFSLQKGLKHRASMVYNVTVHRKKSKKKASDDISEDLL